MSRQKAKRNFPKGFEAKEEEVRFGTPIEVASYRADRLMCDTLLEIGCGVGFQTLAFAKVCKKVIAVDIDKTRIDRAKWNLAKYGIKNVEFHAKDALDKEFIKSLPKINVIFCDPSRPPSEEERKAASLSPTIEEIQQAYKNVKELAYEVPPFLKELPEDAEKEFLTLNGALNRLTLYFGNLKQAETSLVDVPSGERLEQESEVPANEEPTRSPRFIGELSPAVITAGLEQELAARVNSSLTNDKKPLLLGDSPIDSAFVRWYRKTDSRNARDIVLHFPIPEDKYKAAKEKLRLPVGKATIHIFKLNDQLVYCERVQ